MNLSLSTDETFDAEAVWSVITDPSVLDRVCDDNWTKLPLEELHSIVTALVENPDNYVMLVSDGSEPVGAVLFYAQGDGVFETHTLFTKRCRGFDAVRMGKAITRYMLALPDVKKLISFCPENLPETYYIARLVGWRSAGMSATKWVKRGVEYAMKAVECTADDLKGAATCH